MWKPNVNRHTQNKSKLLVELLRKDILSGRLSTGERLPTQNDLVHQTGIAKSTIAHAYQEANKVGLINTIVGRGSFVAGESNPFFQAVDKKTDAILDLRVNYPLNALDPNLSDTLAKIASNDSQHLLMYQDHAGSLIHRKAGQRWLELNDVERSADEIVITTGAQHALTVCLSTVAQSGQSILVEELTYPGIKETAEMLGLNLIPIEMDSHGIVPEALETALYNNRDVKAFYTSPTIQNPTTILTPTNRRIEIAEICQEHGIFIIEDDINRLFSNKRPKPYASILPELTFFIASFSKVVCGGLRVAYVTAPQITFKTLKRRILATHWAMSPLLAEIANRWINDSTASSTLLARIEEAKVRCEMARRILGKSFVRKGMTNFYIWIDLPPEWTAELFICEAFQNNIAVLGDGSFRVIPHPSCPGIRLGLGGDTTREDLENGLMKLAEMLKDGPGGTTGNA